MSGVTITPISSSNIIGEGPVWLEKSQSLIYVDIPKGNAYRYFPATKRTQTLHLEDIGTGGTIGYIVPVEDTEDEFVLGVGRSLASVSWSPEEADNVTKTPRLHTSIDLNETETRFNDGKCDPAGRLWAGTMTITSDPHFPDHKGSLYKFTSDLKSEVSLDKVTISNGLSWSEDRTKMYYIDSAEWRVNAFDYDFASGNISNKQTLFDLKASGVKGIPDGMTSDINGNLWVACFTGYQVLCIDTTVGKLVRKIDLPSSMTTSCCFGGPDYSTLYVTSGSVDHQPDDFKKYPHSGKVFALTGTGAKGVAPNKFKVNDQYWVK